MNTENAGLECHTKGKRRGNACVSINRKSFLSANLPVYPSIYLLITSVLAYLRLMLTSISSSSFFFHTLHAFESFFREAARRGIRAYESRSARKREKERVHFRDTTGGPVLPPWKRIERSSFCMRSFSCTPV